MLTTSGPPCLLWQVYLQTNPRGATISGLLNVIFLEGCYSTKNFYLNEDKSAVAGLVHVLTLTVNQVVFGRAADGADIPFVFLTASRNVGVRNLFVRLTFAPATKTENHSA